VYILLGWRRIVVKEFQALPENFDIINTKNLYYSTFPRIMEEANSKI